MAIYITEDCINCGACEPECPNNAIYEPGMDWKYSQGTGLKGDNIHFPNKASSINADASNKAVSDEIYFIVSDKCTECQGFHDEPQCAAVCPVDCCIPDDNHQETEAQLLEKKKFLHIE